MNALMAGRPILFRAQVAIAVLITLMAWPLCPEGVAAASGPAAPTMVDAHLYFDSQVSGHSVKALYKTLSRGGDVLGYESFPVRQYVGRACHSGLTLDNGVEIGVDWTIVEKVKFSDGSLNILRDHYVQFISFHMITVEGGIMIEASTPLPQIILAINDELSRDRLAKAMDLLSSACRAKSVFD